MNLVKPSCRECALVNKAEHHILGHYLSAAFASSGSQNTD